jgi:hypothetical protein
MLARSFRALATVVAATVAVGMVGTTAAEAKPPTRPGGVTVTASATEPAIGSYAVAVSWNTVTNATSYKATISRSGAILDSAKVTAPTTTWNATVAAVPGQQLSVSVRALVGTRQGKPTTKTLVLTDQIAPTASYTSVSDTNTGAASLTENGLTDDSPVSGVTRTVDWGDGQTVVYGPGVPITHNYAQIEARYVPHVTLKDAAGHTSVSDSTGIVIADTLAPTGTFTVAVATAWAKLTSVTLTQTSLADNWSPPETITRSVDWGDGTVMAWPTGASLSHVYTVAGEYTPKVTLTDEAHKTSLPIDASAVVVSADTVKPVVRLLLPKAKHSVKAWRTLRGKATDTAGTGVKFVKLRAVEKRGTSWYAYKPATKTWVRATTKARAFAKSGTLTVHTTATHLWGGKLVGLRKGTLVYRVRATDRVGNASAVLTHMATLTRR